MAEVSICIPAYNNAESLRRLLQSISIQTYLNYEVIITDDSTNQSVYEVVTSFKRLSIQYHRNEKQLGPTANTNAAILLANGKFIKVMHHDDSFSTPDSLMRMVQLLNEKPEAVIAFCGTNELVFLENNEIDHEKSYSRSMSDIEKGQLDCDWRNLFLVNMIGAPSATIFRRKSLLFDEKLKWLVDVEFYMRLLQQKHCYTWTKDALINIGISETQVTKTCLVDNTLMFRENQYVYMKYELYQERVYRKRLIRMAIQMRLGRKILKENHISSMEYYIHWIRMHTRTMLSK